jgi:hypothetical protein
MKFSLHCCQFLGIAERLLWSEQIGKLCDSNQPLAVVETRSPVFGSGVASITLCDYFWGATFSAGVQ